MYCDVCHTYNGSCNQYVLFDYKRLTICPACLAWSDNDKAKIARQAHKEGRFAAYFEKAKKSVR